MCDMGGAATAALRVLDNTMILDNAYVGQLIPEMLQTSPLFKFVSLSVCHRTTPYPTQVA